MLPFEFTIPGTPVSHQTRNRSKLASWQKLVRAAAASIWGTRQPLEVPLRLTVSYYHEGEAVRIDNDNMLKPIQDALIGLVYTDDRLITDTIVRKTNISGEFRVRGYSLVLLKALSEGNQFLHVVVDEAPSHENPLR